MENSDFDPVPGVAEQLEPGIRRVLAPNPSPMTFRGTNTYIVGSGHVAVIDPGPADPGHMRAILAALEPHETVSHICVTHSHLDHSPLAAPLAEFSGAPVLALGNSLAGRAPHMEALAARGLTGGGEGVDAEFTPQHRLDDDEIIDGEDWRLQAIWTPGHFGNHLCFAFDDTVFTGDHIMGWASTMVSPPDGDLTAFMASSQRMLNRDDRVYYPGHGAPIADPKSRMNWIIAHRRRREADILVTLGGTHWQIPDLTRAIYTDTPAALLPAAERNVFAHLIDLHIKTQVGAEPALSQGAWFFKR